VRLARASLVVAAAFLAGIGGAFVGQHFAARPAERGGAALHRVLHEELKLDPAQAAALDRLERDYALRRRALEAGMRAENARLAAAIEQEHGDGPKVDAAIEASHRTMGRLQKETVAHVFAMRRLLRPDQTPRFDRAVAEALVDDGR
jgi:hypothetical protein